MLPPIILPTSPLALAARAGDVPACRKALDDFPDQAEDLNGAMRLAITARRPAVVDLLLEAGVDPSTLNGWLVCVAAGVGDEDILRSLHRHGADVTAQMNRPIFEAAMNGHADACRLLIELGADPNAVSARALEAAVTLGHADAARVLLMAGADPSLLSASDKAAGLRRLDPLSLDIARLLYPERSDAWIEKSARSKGNVLLADALAADMVRDAPSARLSRRPRMG